MGRDAMIFVFWLLSFKPAFSLSSFTLIKSLFSSSLLSAIWVVSSAYLRLLIFLLAILIPACVSSSLAFHMMYSAYKFNKQGDNIQPWCTPLPTWNQSIVPQNQSIVPSSYIRISNMFCVEGPVPMITWPPPALVTRETRVPLEVKTGSADSSHTWKCFPSHWTWVVQMRALQGWNQGQLWYLPLPTWRCDSQGRAKGFWETEKPTVMLVMW